VPFQLIDSEQEPEVRNTLSFLSLLMPQD